MRVCPKCGYIDPPYWKHVKYSYYIDASSLENFKLLCPELAKRIAREKVVSDEHFIYRLCKKGTWVERKAKVDFVGETWSDKCEKHDGRLKWKRAKDQHDFYRDWQKEHPAQKKLVKE